MDKTSLCGGALMLRRHKMLPHPMRKLNLTLDTARSLSTNSGKLIASSVAKPTAVLNMPPTPPTNSRIPSGNDHMSRLSPYPVNNFAPSRPNNDVPTDVLRIGNDPPTPEFTPPRYLHPSSSSTINFYTPSSRSNSFVTAPEDPYTSADDSGRYAMMTFLPATNSHLTLSDTEQICNDPRYDVEEYRDNRGIRPKIRYSESPPKITGLGNMQDRYPSDDSIDPENCYKSFSLRKNGTLRQKSGDRVFQTAEVVYANEAIETTSGAKFYLSTQPTESIQPRHGYEFSPGNFQNSPGYLSNTETLESDEIYNSSIRKSTRRRVNDRQIYEHTCARVLKSNGPQAQPKTLRHSKKQSSLRGLSNQLNIVSEPTSPNGSLKDHGCTTPSVLKATKPVYSRSVSSTTMSPRLNMKRRQEIIKNGGIPVLVIPERIQSTKASRAPSLGTKSSYKIGRSVSVNSASLSHYTRSHTSCGSKITTLEDDFSSEFAGTEYFESTQNHSPSFLDLDLSLSDHISRKTSRTGSLTAKSLEDHNRFLSQNLNFKNNTCAYSPTDLNRSTSSSGLSIYVTVDDHGNPLSKYALSDQVTPYSQSSYETAGTNAEVSQALAVSLYPHQIQSLVMVQHSASAESSSSPPNLNSMHMTESRAINTDMYERSDTSTYIPSHSDSGIGTESLFQNPRNPPCPPAIKCIPPTPRTADKNYRPASQDPSSTDSESLKEQTITIHESMLPLGDHSLTELYSIADVVPDRARLHPFWRPSRIRDFSEDIKDYLNYDHNSTTYKQAPGRRSISERLKRSIGMFSKDGSPARRSKSGEYVTVSRTSSSSSQMNRQRFRPNIRERMTKFDAEGNEGWGFDFKNGNGGQIYSIPGLGLRIENIGWKDLKRWASERKREKKREELRRIIGEPEISTTAK